MLYLVAVHKGILCNENGNCPEEVVQGHMNRPLPEPYLQKKKRTNSRGTRHSKRLLKERSPKLANWPVQKENETQRSYKTVYRSLASGKHLHNIVDHSIMTPFADYAIRSRNSHHRNKETPRKYCAAKIVNDILYWTNRSLQCLGNIKYPHPNFHPICRLCN